MSESWVRGLGNIRKCGSRDCKCKKLAFEGLEMLESLVRRLVNVRNLGSGAGKC